MKKIAFYIESMVVGGAEKVLIDLVNHMDRTKYDISVIAIFKKSVYNNYHFQFQDFFHENIHYVTLVDNTSSFRYRFFNYAYAHFGKKRLYRKLIKKQYDIEVAFYEGFSTEFIANSGNEKSEKYAWLHTDNTRLHQNKSPQELEATKKVYKQYKKVIGVSNQVTQSFLKFFPDIQTTTIYNLLDVDLIEQKSNSQEAISNKFNSEKEGIVFLTVGRLIKIKGYLRLLDALSKLKKEGFSFLLYMIGEGEQREEIDSKIQTLDLEENVILLGHQDNPYPYMKKADYLVCSSYAEGFSTVVVEAVLCELPVITTDCAGMKDIFGEESCGIICENSEEGIYEALKKVIEEPSTKEIFEKGCCKRKAFFSVEKRLQAVDELFLSVDKD